MPPRVAKEARRLFFALWPSAESCAEIEAATAAVVRERGGRIIPSRNFHVTLLFLGDVLPSRLAAVQLAGAMAADTPPFQLNFDRIEAWGRKVLCLTASACPAAAIQLAEKLRDGLGDEAPQASEHEFRPHLTLARDLPRARRPEPIKTLSLEAREFVLAESQRGADGSHYSVVARWPLLSLPSTPNPAVADHE